MAFRFFLEMKITRAFLPADRCRSLQQGCVGYWCLIQKIELAVSDRIGRPIRVTAAASECLNGLARELPLHLWEL